MSIVNRNQLAEIFDIAVMTIDSYRRSGMPCEKKENRELAFDTAVCIAWLIDQKRRKVGGHQDYDDARTRDRLAIAELREIELAQKRGELVTLDEFSTRLETEYGIVKAGFRALPSRLAQPLSVESDATKIERMIKSEVDEILSTLASDPT